MVILWLANWLLLPLLLATASCTTCDASSLTEFPSDNKRFIIAGYLPNYRSYINVNHTALVLTDLILFSMEPDSSGSLRGRCCLDSSHYSLARKAQAYKATHTTTNTTPSLQDKLNLWVSIGGAGRSTAFPAIVSNSTATLLLLTELIALCQKEGFNGIDFDWEQPTTEKEYGLYCQFLINAANALHRVNLLVSVTTRQTFASNVVNAVDRILFMGYDLLYPNGPKHHAHYQIVTQTIDQWMSKYNYPSQVIVLGLPAYARHESNPSLVKTFAELVDDGMDPTSLTIGNSWKGYLFDTIHDISKKVMYAKQNHLGGVFFWELGHDKQNETYAPSGWLLEAAGTRVTNITAITTASKGHENDERNEL